jgi:hypothetical protein
MSSFYNGFAAGLRSGQPAQATTGRRLPPLVRIRERRRAASLFGNQNSSFARGWSVRPARAAFRPRVMTAPQPIRSASYFPAPTGAKEAGEPKSSATVRRDHRREASGQGENLRQADLSAGNLARARLSGADLTGAQLERSSLWAANLVEANLEGARLSRADLCAAGLSGARLRGASLQSANLFQADLTGADLRRANLRRAVLAGANLKGARLAGASLRNANLRGADLSGAKLFGTDLHGALFNRATRWPSGFNPVARGAWPVD